MQVRRNITFITFIPQHWSGTILPTSPADLWPQEMSLHSACALVDPKFFHTAAGSLKSTCPPQSCDGPPDTCPGLLQPKVFVLWGTGNINIEITRDAWILEVNRVTWNRVLMHAS